MVIRRGISLELKKNLNIKCHIKWIQILGIVLKEENPLIAELHKTDLHIFGNYGKEKIPFYNRLNTVSQLVEGGKTDIFYESAYSTV